MASGDTSGGSWEGGHWNSDWRDANGWQDRSRGSNTGASGSWESQGWEGSYPAGGRSLAPIWENWEDWGWNNRGREENHSRGWENSRRIEERVDENHSRGWEEQGVRGEARTETEPPRPPRPKRDPPRPKGVEFATPALLNVALDEIQRDLPVGAGCGNQGCPCGSQVSADDDDPLLDLSFFQQWKGQPPPWREHSAALKWLRSVHRSQESFKLPLEIQKKKIQHYAGTS